MGQEGHALDGPHGDVERTSDVHGHGGRYGDGVGDVHGGGGGDVDRRDVDWPRDGHWVLETHRRRDVDSVGANVHLSRDGHWVVRGVAPVHGRGDGGRRGHWGGFVTGVKVGLSVGFQMAGNVGCTQHLSTDATGDFAFVSDHV